jgi:hypothetical protein
MAQISKPMREYVDTKLGQAAEEIETTRSLVPRKSGYMNFDMALRVIHECRSAVDAASDIDTVSGYLRTASDALGQFRSGPAEPSVAEAIRLIDQAIGGEMM